MPRRRSAPLTAPGDDSPASGSIQRGGIARVAFGESSSRGPATARAMNPSRADARRAEGCHTVGVQGKTFWNRIVQARVRVVCRQACTRQGTGRRWDHCRRAPDPLRRAPARTAPGRRPPPPHHTLRADLPARTPSGVDDSVDHLVNRGQIVVESLPDLGIIDRVDVRPTELSGCAQATGVSCLVESSSDPAEGSVTTCRSP